MGIIIPQDLISSLKYKHLLLDTNVFIDFLNHPEDLSDFLIKLRNNNITLVTIDLVKIEFLRGSQDDSAYNEKEKIFEDITESILPTDSAIVENVYELLKQYKILGRSIAIADLFLGANLIKYGPELYLLTRNTTDFPSNIFNLNFIINYPLKRSIFTYGVYSIR